MLDSMLTGLAVLIEPAMMLYVLVAILLGLVFGILPGLQGMTLMAIFIPFTWGMDPILALGLLTAGWSVANNGGSITAILLNVPGTGTNAATLVDGFPMAQQGKAGRALGAALTASALGGLEGGLVLALLVPVVVPLVIAFGSPESFFLIVMGLNLIAVLGGESKIKGLISGLLGLLLAFVGYYAGSGFARYTFGTTYLLDGIKIIPCILGIFALPEMMALMLSGGTIVSNARQIVTPAADIWEGVKDVFRHWWLFLRCSAIGTLIGIVPGTGGSVAVWVAYGYAKATSKNSDTYGTGNVEGVIAPESANNAKEGGAMLTTLALGIPGSPAMAVLMGGFLILGLQPGPAFLVEHLDIAFSMVGVLIIANILGAGICILAAPLLVKVTRVPGQILAPFVLCIISLGAFSYRNSISDVMLMFALSIFGWAMKQFGYSRPAFFLGFILGGLAERYFGISIKSFGWTFFLTPISLVIIGLTILGVFYQPLMQYLKRGRGQ
jgi:TctA family transporter